MIISALTDPQYLAPITQDRDLPYGSAAAADPEYLESGRQEDVQPWGFTELTFLEPPPPPDPFPPDITLISPPTTEELVKQSTIEVIITDVDPGVVLRSIQAWVVIDDLATQVVTSGSGFPPGWLASSLFAIPGGYRLSLTPDALRTWRTAARVTLTVFAADYNDNSRRSVFTWDAEAAVLPKIYPMLFDGIRRLDEENN